MAREELILPCASTAITLAIVVDQCGRRCHRHATTSASDDHRQTILGEPTSGNGIVRHFKAKVFFDKVSESFHFWKISFLFPFRQVYSTIFFRKLQESFLDVARLSLILGEKFSQIFTQ